MHLVFCDAIKIVISNCFPPCGFVVVGILFLCFEVEGETMRLITFLTEDFMAFGTKLLVENVKEVLHHFKFLKKKESIDYERSW